MAAVPPPHHLPPLCQELCQGLMSFGKSTFRGAAIGLIATSTVGTCCLADTVYRCYNPAARIADGMCNERLSFTAGVIVSAAIVGPLYGGMMGAVVHAIRWFSDPEL